jgi:hypothetical protein
LVAPPSPRDAGPSRDQAGSSRPKRLPASRAVARGFAPHRSEKQCREIIRIGSKPACFIEQDYMSPSRDGREVTGLFVDNAKRPGSWIN